MDKQLLTSREVADRFRVDVTSVRRWVAEGKLKVAARTPGGQFRFSEEAVRSLADHRDWAG